MKKKLIVMAATKIDVDFGLKLLKKLGVPMIPCYLSENPQEQTLLQMNPKELLDLVYKKLSALIKDDIACLAIYCNSLSGAIGSHHLAELKQDYKLPIITPLEIYEDIALQFQTFGAFVANSQSASHIEKTLLNRNPRASAVSFASIKLVEDIESLTPPGLLLDRYEVVKIFQVFAAHGCDAILIGCTHFVYFMKELSIRLQKASFPLPLIEPSEEILRRVSAHFNCH